MARPLAQPPPGRCRQSRGSRRQRQNEGALPHPEGGIRSRGGGAQDTASTRGSQRQTQPSLTLAVEAAAGLLCPPQGAGCWVGPPAALRARAASGRARFPGKRPRAPQACLPLRPPGLHPSSALLALGSTARETGSSPPELLAPEPGAGQAGRGRGRAWGQRGRAEGSLSATSNRSPGRRAPGGRLCQGAQLHTPIPPTVWNVSTCVSCKHVGLKSRLDSLTSAPAGHVLCCPLPGRASPSGRPRETSGVTADLPSPWPSIHTA